MTEHCWHHDGMEYTVYPSFHYETCCYCGKKRRVGGKFAHEQHGPYLLRPDGRIIPDIQDVGPCEPVETKP